MTSLPACATIQAFVAEPVLDALPRHDTLLADVELPFTKGTPRCPLCGARLTDVAVGR